jgi:hypothetical protein
MVVQTRNLITENEKNRILGLYGRPQLPESVVISDWLSPDEKYCIFFDDLIDIENKTKIGNIWENFEHFKFFLKHSFEVATNVPQEIKESALTLINSFLITESNQNMASLKPYVKELLNENVFTDLGNWAVDTAKGTVQGIKNFTTTSIDGLKKLYTNIKDGDWKKALSLIGKGILYVARSIRSALYNPFGLLLDAILVATGIGKGVQWIPWAIVVALDVYEFITGNYEDPNLSMGWRLLFFGVDILGLVTAGIAAKGGRVIINGLIKRFGTTSEAIVKSVQSNKTLTGILENMLKSTSGASSLMQRASTHLQKNAPSIYNFLKGAFSAVGKFITMMVNFIKSILKGTFNAVSAPGRAVKTALGGGKAGIAAQQVVNVGVPIAAFGTYQKWKERKSQNTSDETSPEIYFANNRETPETYGGV